MTLPETTEMIERVKRVQGEGESMLRKMITEILQAYLKGEVNAATAAETFLKNRRGNTRETRQNRRRAHETNPHRRT